MSTQLQQRRGEKKTKRKKERWNDALQHASLWVFSNSLRLSPMWNQTVSKKRKEKKTAYSTEGLFFSINNSFWHIGEEVKLDIPEEHGLQQRMTRNNEEILPQTLSPAEWRHESTKKKIKKLLSPWFIKGNNFPLCLQ